MAEEIPDSSLLYRRVHKSKLDGGISKSAFALGRGERGVSVDWADLTTAQRALERAKVPEHNALYSLSTGGVRSLGLIVEHDPVPDNPAHSLVIGDNGPAVRFKLARMCRLVLDVQEW